MPSILVVDDNEGVLETVADSLRSLPEELQVHTASSGEDALECARLNEIELVITDAEMPVMNGIELLKRWKMMWPRTPVVVMSGDAGLRHRAIYSGANDILAKPFTQERLEALVFGLLHQYPGGR